MLCFYKGLNTIGGTVVEVRTGDARCIFDFGLGSTSEIDRRIQPRPETMVHDYIKAGHLPMTEGLYDRADLKNMPLASYTDVDIKPFVLISHMHIDHMGALGFLSKEVEVYTSLDSLRLYRGLEKTKDILFRSHKNITGLAPMEWVKRGSIAFRMVPVDHDVPGACGFEIATPDGRIAYTGDLRLHGFCAGDSLAFADAVHRADVCITEGVTVSFIEDFNTVVPDASLDSATTEMQVVQDISTAAIEAKGLVFINLYNRNLQRLALLFDTLNDAGRQLVLEPDTAVLFNHFSPGRQLFVYEPLCLGASGAYNTLVTREEILAHPEKFAVQLSYQHLLETIDYDPSSSLYIHSNGVPLGDYDPGYQLLCDFLSKQGTAYLSIGCGGHASPAHLKYILEAIAPKYLIPLHSLTPEKVRIDGSLQILPKAGQYYRLRFGVLTECNEEVC